MDHPLQCWCGALRGSVSHPERGNRGICYCRDCQAYAHFLGQPAAVLDDLGGTEIVATSPQYVTFTQGVEQLACMSLSDGGLLRWYARCCNTPIGNTQRNFKISFVGLVHSCLARESSDVEQSFGPIRMRSFVHGAKVGAKEKIRSTPLSTIAVMLRMSRMMIAARLSGSYRDTPFFDAEHGKPVATPTVLTGDELLRVMQAV